ncbi:FYN-binding protein 2 isoform X2 [Colius striatus]|uniref:FYN-binding protein 2 isoform X2 n=1 Tax=Colius striatus TaxID=57412 RepID=UPI002B1CE3B8|nr:FYN-binding protein 2 isoform X2 [Colius striatus]
MDVEDVTDFRALRAKFQNDSNLANKLLQPWKKPPMGIPPKLGSANKVMSSPLLPRKREVMILKPKDEPAQPASQPLVLTQCSPSAWPRAKLAYVEPTVLDEGNVSEKGLNSPKSNPEKPLSSSCTDHQGSSQTSQLPISFHHALQICENTLFRSEKASAMFPAQRAANLYVYPSPEQRATCAPAASGSSRIRLSRSKPVLDLPAWKKDALAGNRLVLPQAAQEHRSSDEEGTESMVATAFYQPDYRGPRENPQHQKESECLFHQPGAGKFSHSPKSKWPRIKPLPSTESLGPAPEKPARPPKFDLSTFQSAMYSSCRGNETTAGEEDYLSPESPGRAEIEDEKEEETSLEGEKEEAKKISKPGGNESPISQTKEDGRGEMKVPQVKQDVTSTQTAQHPTPQGLAKDRAELSHCMYFGAPKPEVERTVLSRNTWQFLQSPENIYDDVGEMQNRLNVSDASSPITSASRNSYEETYEDVEIGSDNPAKTEWSSLSLPNLVAASQEDSVYDDVQVEQREPRNIFKVKSNVGKSKKMEKEEKLFRETFMYDKEIKVISTATAQCSVPSKRRVDLAVTAGEQLDVIDVTEGNAVICRSSEGRYGYVLVEHLNFSTAGTS